MDTLIFIGCIIFVVFLAISLGAYTYGLYCLYKLKREVKQIFGKKVIENTEKIIEKKLGNMK